jgi:hypothetical protein
MQMNDGHNGARICANAHKELLKLERLKRRRLGHRLLREQPPFELCISSVHVPRRSSTRGANSSS